MDFDLFNKGWDADQARKDEPFHWISGARVFLGRYSPDVNEGDTSLRILYIGRLASINQNGGSALITNLGLNERYKVHDIFRVDAKTLLAYLLVPGHSRKGNREDYSVFVDLRLLDIHD